MSSAAFVRSAESWRLPSRIWGDRSFEICIGGGHFRLTGLNPEQVRLLEDRYETVANPVGHPSVGDRQLAVEITLSAVRSAAFRPFDRDQSSVALGFDYQERGLRFAGLGLMGIVRLPTGLSPLSCQLLTEAGSGSAFADAVENCLRVLTAYRLLNTGGVLLHSSAAVSSRGAWIFCGHSGAGKTTVARIALAAGREVLSDDLNALFPRARSICVERLPFAGELGCQSTEGGSFALRAIYLLEKADRPALAPVSPAVALAALLSCCPFVNGDPYRLDALTQRLSGWVRRTEVKILRFDRKGAFLGLLNDEVSGAA